MNTVASMKEEILSRIANGEDFNDIKDNRHEMIDSWLPIYNNDIIREWTEMPSEYDNRGIAEGWQPADLGIVGLMSLDLYFWYSDLADEAIAEVEADLEGADA